MCLNTNINFIFFPSILGNPTTLSFPCAVDTVYSWGRITINCVITFARSMAHPNIESLMFPASLLKMMNQVCIDLIDCSYKKERHICFRFHWVFPEFSLMIFAGRVVAIFPVSFEFWK